MAKLTPAAYAASLLVRNPHFDAEAIVEQRSRIFNRKAKAKATSEIDPEQMQRDRVVVHERLAEIRKGFWSMGMSELNNQLSDSRFKKVPDVAVAARRLQDVARLRPEFPRLAQHKRCNPALFNALRRVITLSPREAGPEKDEMLHQIRRSKNLKACKAMVKMMRSEFPEVYKVEEDWLEAVGSLKASKTAAQSGSYTSNGDGEFPWWVIWVGIIILRIILRAMIQ